MEGGGGGGTLISLAISRAEGVLAYLHGNFSRTEEYIIYS